MPRGLSSAVQSVLAGLTISGLKVAVSLNTASINVWNGSRDLTLGTTTYTGLGKDGLVADGLGENMLGNVPAPRLVLRSLDFAYHDEVDDDEFRGDTATVTLLYLDAGTWTATGWTSTFNVDADAMTANEVALDLTTGDAARGTTLPRRMTQESGCQHDYKRGGCPYRGPLTECDKTYDGLKGCKAHFPDFTQDGETWVQSKPYGAFIGYINKSVVSRG